MWGLSYIDLDGPWGWNRLDLSAAKAILTKVNGWATMRQSELLRPGGKQCIPLHKLSPEAQRRLEELKLDDLDGLWELRLAGKQRIWGHREGHVFYLMWWDPEHTVCPTSRR